MLGIATFIVAAVVGVILEMTILALEVMLWIAGGVIVAGLLPGGIKKATTEGGH